MTNGVTRVFATQTHNKEKPVADGHAQPADRVIGKGCPDANPLWQSLALRSNVFQPRLAVGHSADRYELAADRVANRMTRAPGAVIQRTCGPCATGGTPCECEDEREGAVQRKADHDGPQNSSSENLLTDLGPGRPLDSATRAFFEPRFARDFSDVRLHVDEHATAAARSINALAFNIGNHVAIRQDNFTPATSAGRRLLGHELTHTIQQASPGFQQKRLISDPQDAAELEAERIGVALAAPDPPHHLNVNASAGAAQIHRDDDEGPHDAGVPPPIAGVPSTEEDQQACVVKLYGCPEARDGGLPTPDDSKRYNEECRKELNYSGPDVQPICAAEKKEEEKKKAEEAEPPPGGNMAHRKLSKADRETIVTATGAAASTGTTLTFSKDGPRFVLHDTGTTFGKLDPKTGDDPEKRHGWASRRTGSISIGAIYRSKPANLFTAI